MQDRFYTLDRSWGCQRGFSLDPAWKPGNDEPLAIKISPDERKEHQRYSQKDGHQQAIHILKINNILIKHSFNPLDFIDGFTVPSAPCGEEAIWLNKAFDCVFEGQYNDAVNAYESAIAINSSNREVWYDLGISYVRLGKCDSAIKCFDNALILDSPTVSSDIDADIWLNKGLIHFKKETYRYAIECLKNCEIIATADGCGSSGMMDWLSFYRFLGYSYYVLNEFKNALLCYEKLEAIDKNDAIDWYNKSVILRRLTRDKESEEAFSKAVELMLDIQGISLSLLPRRQGRERKKRLY